MVDDFFALTAMRYSGRGIAVGLTRDGKLFVGYSLTGRSPSSQARKLVYDGPSQTISTEVTDVEQLRKGNPALLIYPAIKQVRDKIVASNGLQTRLLHEVIDSTDLKQRQHPANILVDAFTVPRMNGQDEQLIDLASYEPDPPNFTPRISACVNENQRVAFCIIRKLYGCAEVSIHPLNLRPGTARIITTYKGGNESPLLPFEGSPLEASVFSTTAQDICRSIYEAIGPKGGDNFRVASAVMLRDRLGAGDTSVAIMNRYQRDE